MTKLAYFWYLKSDHWLATAKRKKESCDYTCEGPGCGCKYGLHVHHRSYRNLGHEDLDDHVRTIMATVMDVGA